MASSRQTEDDIPPTTWRRCSTARAKSSSSMTTQRPSRPSIPTVARLATQMLQGVVKSGTGKRAALGDRPVAGKTGTSQDNADAWFVGYTPQLVTAVWMGAPEGRIPMRNVGGINVTGGSYPAKVWHEFMDKALEGQPVLQFAVPPELPERNRRACTSPSSSAATTRRLRSGSAATRRPRSATTRRVRIARRRARRPRRRRSTRRSRRRRCPVAVRCLPCRRTTS